MSRENEGLIVAIGFGVIIGVVLGGSALFAAVQCGAKTPGMDSDWGPVQGCMVKVNGKWVPYDRWRVVDE